jgi:hypothetical protein
MSTWDVESIVDQLPAHFLKYFGRICPGLRQRTQTRRIKAILGSGLNRTIRQGSKESVNNIDELVTQIAARLRIKIEIHDC